MITGILLRGFGQSTPRAVTPTAVTICPSDEAGQAIAARINTAIIYTLPQPATYTHAIIDQLEEVDGLRVDVAHVDMQQLEETFDMEGRSSHLLRVWVRDKLPDMDAATVAPRNLLARKIFQRVNNYATGNGRVRVWDAGKNRGEIPGMLVLVEANFYRAYLELRVEVEPSL